MDVVGNEPASLVNDAEKALNKAQLSGAVYNNVEGDFAATLGDGNNSTIPAITLSKANGEALLNQLGNNATLISHVAPNGSGYEAWDGTHMATPHVSAVAALVWSAKPSLTNVELRNILANSTEDLGNLGGDHNDACGLVNTQKAVDSVLNATNFYWLQLCITFRTIPR